jgi:hypothetical protein
MAGQNQDSTDVVRVSSHNINGFARNKSFLKQLCDSVPNSIRAIQEHWLRPAYKKQYGVNQLRAVHQDFDGFGTSAMKTQMQNGIKLGRPFGGTGFVYSKKYSDCMRPLVHYQHERITVVELSHSMVPFCS